MPLRARLALLPALLIIALLAGCAGTGGAEEATSAPTAAATTAASPAEAATTAPAAAVTTAPTQAATAAASPTSGATATTEATAEATGGPTSEATASAGAGDAPEGALVSQAVDEAPELDGAADDNGWNDAPVVEIKTAGGENESDTTVRIQSVHDDEMVYFLLQWDDPTESFLRVPWEKQADGSWKQVKDPNDKGGDNNTTYEDKIAFIWNIDNSIENFEQAGCFTTCHVGENSDVKPYGNKYTPGEGQIGDIWHWKSVRNLNQVDDQYLDNTKYSPDTPEAGRKSDKKESGGYVDNITEDKKGPAFMPPNGGSKDGAPGYILDDEKVPFDDSLFKAGDRLPAIIKSAITGDRGDLSAGWTYEDGTWTLEIGRKLVTGSQTDVQFDDLSATYHFGIATFDNAQVRHAFQSGATPFVFAGAE